MLGQERGGPVALGLGDPGLRRPSREGARRLVHGVQPARSVRRLPPNQAIRLGSSARPTRWPTADPEQLGRRALPHDEGEPAVRVDDHPELARAQLGEGADPPHHAVGHVGRDAAIPLGRPRASETPRGPPRSGEALSCRLPNRSTHPTWHQRTLRPSATASGATAEGGAGPGTSGSIGVPMSTRAARPGTTTPPPGRTCLVRRRSRPRARPGGPSSSTAATAPPPRSAAGTSSPLSGPTKYRCPPPFASARRATPRRADPTPGSTTASTTPGAEMRQGPHEGPRAGRHVEGRHLVGQVDDHRARAPAGAARRGRHPRTRRGYRSRRGRRRCRAGRHPADRSARLDQAAVEVLVDLVGRQAEATARP